MLNMNWAWFHLSSFQVHLLSYLFMKSKTLNAHTFLKEIQSLFNLHLKNVLNLHILAQFPFVFNITHEFTSRNLLWAVLIAYSFHLFVHHSYASIETIFHCFLSKLLLTEFKVIVLHPQCPDKLSLFQKGVLI